MFNGVHVCTELSNAVFEVNIGPVVWPIVVVDDPPQQIGEFGFRPIGRGLMSHYSFIYSHFLSKFLQETLNSGSLCERLGNRHQSNMGIDKGTVDYKAFH